ncbi:MAG TPA: acetyl-CoA carboxylase biotin carboxylase subunit, partial [Desulfomicrobiaceae bacterium]|nr:acetyl-CoA carboxylase biotin carboxylase subunit [Desulfomicrobiaceae bacterium]
IGENRDVDLIAEQIRVALGAPLGFEQEKIGLNGVGIEYRLIAEDPDNKFAPWVGTIEKFSWPERPWVRMHTQVPTDRPYEIPTDYDPNLALAIIWGKDLEESKARGLEFLDSLVLEGKSASGDPLRSNVSFMKAKTEHLLKF